jgi:hypothetical protein
MAKQAVSMKLMWVVLSDDSSVHAEPEAVRKTALQCINCSRLRVSVRSESTHFVG